ncbi:MAG: hypothetical protein AB7S77_21010 [Desulfatirhabdiaceae bacterium]
MKHKKFPSSPVGATCVFRLQAAPMELDGNNYINFYKQVAPTGRFWKIFSFLEAIKPLIMSAYRENTLGVEI